MIEVLDFYADWCGPCKIMKPIFEEVEKGYEGKVTFKKIDVEADNSTASQHGVMSIPTYIVTKEGKEVGRKIGAMPKDVLKQWIEGFM